MEYRRGEWIGLRRTQMDAQGLWLFGGERGSAGQVYEDGLDWTGLAWLYTIDKFSMEEGRKG